MGDQFSVVPDILALVAPDHSKVSASMDGWAASKARAAIGLISEEGSEEVFIFKRPFLKEEPPAERLWERVWRRQHCGKELTNWKWQAENYPKNDETVKVVNKNFKIK